MTQPITPAGIPSAEQSGAPAAGLNLAPAGIPPAERVGAAAVGLSLLLPAGIPSAERVGAPTAVQNLAPAGIPSAEWFGPPVAALLVPAGIPPAEMFGAPAVCLTLLLPAGIGSAEMFGRPTVVALPIPPPAPPLSPNPAGSPPFNIAKRYPSNPLTPVGGCHMMAMDQPIMAYRSYDDAIVFNMMGPLSIWDPTTPESIRLKSLKGLIPPWKNIRQKGATQDGSTFITSLYDECQADLEVIAKGRNPRYTRQLIRDWYASWDAKLPGTLSWFTPELGYWWAKMRWAKPPLEPFLGGNFTRQKMTVHAECDDAFWRSYDSTAVFAFSYRSATDNFQYTTTGSGASTDLGPNWNVAYNASGLGYLHANGKSVTSTIQNGRVAVAQRVGYISATDEQIVTVTIGPIDPWPAATNTYIDIWARMSNTGTPGQNGVRCRLGYLPGTPGSFKHPATAPTAFVELSYWVNGAKTVLANQNVTVPWKPGDQISLAVGGFSGQLYSYFVQRGTNPKLGSTNVTWATLLTVVHPNPDGSLVGANYRGAGFGMEADGSQIPANLAGWTAGDSTAAEESGYLTLYNAGDQVAWPYFILVGPGIFGIGDGPQATQAVTYGPLLDNQMVLILTDPRKYAVTNLTAMPSPGTPVSSQLLTQLEAAQQVYQSFIAGQQGPVAPTLSPFGVPFPQGNPYALLSGRFSVPLAAKAPGSPIQPQQIAIAVESGSPSTAILAGVTPLRRYPD